jgi:hypothetical protein
MFWPLVTPEKLCTAEFLGLLDGVHDNGELNRLVVDEVKNPTLSSILSVNLTSRFYRRTVYL